MTNLPEGWATSTIGELSSRVTKGTTPKTYGFQYQTRGVRFVKAESLAQGRIQQQLCAYVSKEAHDSFTRSQLQSQDVLFTIAGTLGRVATVEDEDVPANTNQAVSIIRLLEPELAPYIARFLTSEAKTIADDGGRGTGLQNLNLQQVSELTIRLPPLPEQHRIVAKFDRLSGKSKRARDHLKHVPQLVEKYKQAVLTSAFRGELTTNWRKNLEAIESADQLIARTEAPEQSRGGREATTNVKAGIGGISVNDPGTEPPPGWAWVSLRRIARQETGHTPSRSHSDYWDGGVAWIGIRDAGNHHGRIINDTLQTISEKGLENSSARLLPAGTVCLSRTASVGYVTVMGRPMATSQDFATWTCTPALLSKYLMYALMAEGDNIREFGEGSTHTTIYFPEIRAFHICLAPLDEQREIIRRIERLFAWIDRLSSDATSASKLIDHLDQAVLAKAFRGELVPQNPNDEPASVLLGRIKAKRAAGAATRLAPKGRKVRA